MIFVDSNIFLYTIFTVDKKKHQASKDFFAKAEEKNSSLWTSDWVIAEIIWFCTRKGTSRNETKQYIYKILRTSYIQVKNKSYILQALDMWNDSIDYIDALNIILLKEELIDDVYTYDKGFDIISSLTRKEP